MTAPAEGGKANAALVALLAKAWGVPKSSIVVVAGTRDQRKRLVVSDGGPTLVVMINRWARTLPNAGALPQP